MEQKKILWILVSVAVFLSIVLAAGLLWFYPSGNKSVVAAGTSVKKSSAGTDFDPVEWVRNSNSFPALKTDKKDSGKDEEFTIVYGDAGSSSKQNDTNKVSVPITVAPDSQKTAAGEPSTTGQFMKPTVKKAKSTPVREPRKVAAETPKISAPAVKKTIKEYWIQAGSFKSSSGAEEARKKLEKEGVASVITTKKMDGTDYYRVRVGPYTNKGEADKFLGWIKKVDNFNKSYISMVTTRR